MSPPDVLGDKPTNNLADVSISPTYPFPLGRWLRVYGSFSRVEGIFPHALPRAVFKRLTLGGPFLEEVRLVWRTEFLNDQVPALPSRHRHPVCTDANTTEEEVPPGNGCGEYVAVMEWLNDNTEVDAYLFKVETVRIHDSRPPLLLTRTVG